MPARHALTKNEGLFGREAIVTDAFTEIPILALIEDERAGLGIVYAITGDEDLIIDVDEHDLSYEHVVRAQRNHIFKTAFYVYGAFPYHR